MTAFTSPKTYTASVAHTAAEGNTYIRDNIKNIDERLVLIGQTSSPTVLGQLRSAPFGCVISKDTDQTGVADSTDTLVTFATGDVTEELDSDALHDPATNSGTRITIPAGGDGWYDIGGCVSFAADTDGYRSLWIIKNGTTQVVRTQLISASASVVTTLNVSSFVLLAAGDYLTLSVRHTAGANLTLTRGSGFAPRFWAMRRFAV